MKLTAEGRARRARGQRRRAGALAGLAGMTGAAAFTAGLAGAAVRSRNVADRDDVMVAQPWLKGIAQAHTVAAPESLDLSALYAG